IRPKVSATPTCDTAPPVTLSITIAPVPAKTRQNVPKNSAISFLPILCERREDSGLKFQLAILGAKLFHFRANFFQQLPRFRELFRVRAGQLGWIWKRPVQSCSHARENRAPCCFGLAAHCNHVGEYVTRRLPNLEDRLCLVARNVDSSLLQRFYRQRIENARFQPSALSFEIITAHLVKQCRSDLAARTVLHANEKNVFLHRPDIR